MFWNYLISTLLSLKSKIPISFKKKFNFFLIYTIYLNFFNFILSQIKLCSENKLSVFSFLPFLSIYLILNDFNFLLQISPLVLYLNIKIKQKNFIFLINFLFCIYLICYFYNFPGFIYINLLKYFFNWNLNERAPKKKNEEQFDEGETLKSRKEAEEALYNNTKILNEKVRDKIPNEFIMNKIKPSGHMKWAQETILKRIFESKFFWNIGSTLNKIEKSEQKDAKELWQHIEVWEINEMQDQEIANLKLYLNQIEKDKDEEIRQLRQDLQDQKKL